MHCVVIKTSCPFSLPTDMYAHSSVKTLLLERASVRSIETGEEKPVGAINCKFWLVILYLVLNKGGCP